MAGTGIACGSDCFEAFGSTTTLTLGATANAGSAFLGWTGACVGAGSCVVTVDSVRSVTANFGLLNAALPNDSFSQASVLTSLPVHVSVDTTSATVDANEPLGLGSLCGLPSINLGKTVWYRYTASAAGPITIDTEGSTFDSAVVVYIGPYLSALQAVACNNDVLSLRSSTSSSLTFNAIAGQTYLIQVGSAVSSGGTLRLTVSGQSASPSGLRPLPAARPVATAVVPAQPIPPQPPGR
ncbi:MAG: hypothetical protein U0821_06255 [Chloroflexota bacterium]